MLQIDNVLISDDVFTTHFVCNLNACKGACCVEGELGAPLSLEETFILEDIYPKIQHLLTKKGVEAIDNQGTSIEHEKDEYSTTLVNGRECAYAIFENGIALCGIEKAWKQGLIDFQKPISCHLYPIRLWEKNNIIGVNYEEWNICNAACDYGEKLKVPVYQFLKDSIIRKFGKEFYEIMDQYYHENQKNT